MSCDLKKTVRVLHTKTHFFIGKHTNTHAANYFSTLTPIQNIDVEILREIDELKMACRFAWIQICLWSNRVRITR